MRAALGAVVLCESKPIVSLAGNQRNLNIKQIIRDVENIGDVSTDVILEDWILLTGSVTR
jgi:hypothetical protein